MRWTPPLLVLLALGAAGCVKVGLGEPHVVSRRTVSSDVITTKKDGDASIRATQHGATVIVRATRPCLATRTKYFTVEREIERERHNLAPATDWYLVLGGLGSAGLGAYLIARPSALDSSSATGAASSDNSSAALGLGISLVALGGILVGVGLIDAARASGSEAHVESTREPGPVLEANASCGTRPLPNAAIATNAPGPSTRALGKTAADGTFEFALEDVVTEGDARATPSMGLVYGGESFATLNLQPLVEIYEGRAWGLAGAEACASSPSDATCTPVEEYLRRYPGGRHAAEARDAMQTYLRNRGNDEWERSGYADCTARLTRESCAGVQRYRLAFSTGAHADTADALLARVQEAERVHALSVQKAADAQAKREREAEDLRERAAQAAAARGAARAACASTCAQACAAIPECQRKCVADKCR